MARIGLAAPIPNYRTLVTLGDSQTDPLQTAYRTRPTQKWTERLAEKLRGAGCPIKGRAFAVSGNTSADLLYRGEFAFRWEVPDLAAIYIGVNDPGNGPSPAVSASATGGSIVATAGSQYVGVAFVSTNSTGQRLALPVTSVQVPVGTTGSLSIAPVTLTALIAQIDVYLTPVTYATAAAAQAAASRSFLFAATPAVNSGATAAATIANLPTGTAPLPSVSTRANTQAIIKALKYAVVGNGVGTRTLWVAGQANLPANAAPGARMIVMDDTSATGGMAALPYSKQHARISGDFSGAIAAQQTVWERRTPQAGEAGWGRVAVTGTPPFADGVSRILVVSTNYLNWTAGGDAAGSPYAPYQTVRAQTLAAVNAENANDTACLYVDLYGYQAGLIASGETAQGSNSWHDITNNQHHNAYGHDIVARACFDALNANRPVWLAALAA